MESAVAGFGVGVLVRLRSRRRWLGLVPVLLVGADHAANNYSLSVFALLGDVPLGAVLSLPFRLAEPLAGFWPLLAIVAATALDGAALRRARIDRPDLLLAGESVGLFGEVAAVGRYARLRPPWTALVAWRFALRRRAVLLGAPDPAAEEVRRVRDLMEQAGRPESWRRARLPVRALVTGALASIPRRPGRLVRAGWPVLLWVILLIPALVYHCLGTTPCTAGVQGLLTSRWIFPLMAGCLLIALVLLVRTVVLTWRALPEARRSGFVEIAATTGARFGTALGALCLSSFLTGRMVTGTDADEPILRNLHMLDALSDVLLIAGIALIIAAFLFFPPVALALTTTGMYVLVPTALAAQFAGTLGLGIAGVMLSQAADDAAAATGRGDGATRGGSGQVGSGRSGTASEPVPDIPQTAPRPKPQVRHWKLQRIVDSLWHKPDKATRIGDGTTMDALRNEIRTARPTGDKWHREKTDSTLKALNKWLDRYGDEATSTDRGHAYKLRAELENLLEEIR